MVTIARGIHLFPFRTEKLSLSALMVLPEIGGRVGRCRIIKTALWYQPWGFFIGVNRLMHKVCFLFFQYFLVNLSFLSLFIYIYFVCCY